MRNSSLFSALSSQEDSHHDASSSRTLHSGSLVLSEAPNQFTPTFHTVTSVLSSIHRADLTLLSISNNASGRPVLPTLPVSPYPVHPGTAIRAHFVVDKEPDEAGWRPWVGGTWSKWVKGTVVGYRDFAGREAQVRPFLSGHRRLAGTDESCVVCSQAHTTLCLISCSSRCLLQGRAEDR